MQKTNIFIIGSKGIPAKYGGFETFVENLTAKRNKEELKYHVACMAKEEGEFEYNHARCFHIKVPNIGPAKAVYYDVKALKKSMQYIKQNDIKQAIIYVCACRIGPFLKYYKRKLNKLGIRIILNPDGQEWKRAKWNGVIKKYWKFSEKLSVKYADFIVCDAIHIEKYIKEEYQTDDAKTTYIAYGAEQTKDELADHDKKWLEWCQEKQIVPRQYYVIVGRFVPENNIETIIKEYRKANTTKELVLVTNVEKNKFYETLSKATNFEQDKRIKFVGTVYDQELLKKIRQEAYGYIHGHEVGGTNPSLLEALNATPLNLLLKVGFNEEVGQEGALYWTKQENNLKELIEKCDKMEEYEIEKLQKRAKERIQQDYTWEKVINQYNDIFS